MKAILSTLLVAVAALSSASAALKVTVKPEQDKLLVKEGQDIVIKIDLTADKAQATKRLPINMVVVLDRSGSMSGAKMEKAKQAAVGLIDQLQDGDIFGLVAYDNEVDVLVPAQRIENKAHLRRKINRIEPGGSTALYEGVEEGAAELRKNLDDEYLNRVILLSDGLANVGPSSPRDISNLGRRLARRGISVTTIGVGDDYNEDVMTALAEASDANYYYVKDTEKLPEVFEEELGSLLNVTARKVRLHITCPEGVEPLGLIGRDETFTNRRASVKFAPLSSGQNRYVFLKCRVEDPRKANEALDLVKVEVEFADELAEGEQRQVNEAATIQFTDDEKEARASVNHEITAEKELQLTALIREKEIRNADSGRYQEASANLTRQASKLRAQAAHAPAPVRAKLEEQAADLETSADSLSAGEYDKRMRKTMQEKAYRQRLAK